MVREPEIPNGFVEILDVTPEEPEPGEESGQKRLDDLYSLRSRGVRQGLPGRIGQGAAVDLFDMPLEGAVGQQGEVPLTVEEVVLRLWHWEREELAAAVGDEQPRVTLEVERQPTERCIGIGWVEDEHSSQIWMDDEGRDSFGRHVVGQADGQDHVVEAVEQGRSARRQVAAGGIDKKVM